MLIFKKTAATLQYHWRDPLLPVWAGAFIDVVGFSVLNPYLAPIFLDLGVPVAQVGLYLSISVSLGFFSGIFWGVLSDRYGRRPILILCRVGALVGYLLLIFSTNLTMLVISRVVDGIFSKNFQIVLTIVGDRTPSDQRSAEMSKAGIAWILGGLIGPAIGAVVFRFGIPGIGIFCSLLSVGALIITILFVPESHPAFLSGSAQDHGLPEGVKPTLSLGLLRQPLPRLRLSQSFFNALSLFVFRISLSLLVTVRFGFTFAQIGLFLTATGLISLLVRLVVFPPLLRKLGDYRTLMVGFLFFMAGFAWLIFATTVWEIAAVTVLIAFGTNCSIDIMNGIMTREVKPSQIGEMIGLNSAVESVALIIGPIIGSALIALPNPAMFGLAATMISVFPVLIGVFHDKRTHNVQPSSELNIPDRSHL